MKMRTSLQENSAESGRKRKRVKEGTKSISLSGMPFSKFHRFNHSRVSERRKSRTSLEQNSDESERKRVKEETLESVGIVSEVGTSWSPGELEVLKNLLIDYSESRLNVSKNYWDQNTWINLASIYNLRATPHRFQSRFDYEIREGGRVLCEQYFSQREAYETRETPVDEGFRRIFEHCPDCRIRVPVFPLTLDGPSKRAGSGSSQCTRSSVFQGGSGLYNNASADDQLLIVLTAMLDAKLLSTADLMYAFRVLAVKNDVSVDFLRKYLLAERSLPEKHGVLRTAITIDANQQDGARNQ